MADDLTIQAQVQQPQVKRKDNTLPYTIGGAAVGGVAGYGINYAVQKPMSHEDIIKTVKDTTQFSERTKEGAPEAATWQTVKEKADEVETAKKELEAASKPVVPANSNEQKIYDDAVKAKEDAYKKLFDTKKAELEGATSGKSFDSTKIKNFSELASTDLPTTNVKSGKPFKGNELEQLYTRLTGDLKNAENALESKLNSGLRAQKNTYVTSLEANINSAVNDLRGKTDEQIAEYFAEKETGSWLGGKHPSTQYKRALDIAEKYYPVPTDLTNEQYISIERKLASGEKPVKGMLPKAVTVKSDKGRDIVKTIYYNEQDAERLLDAEKERIKGLRTAAADQIFAETQKAVAIKGKLGNLVDKVSKEITVDIAKETGLYTPATAGHGDSLDLAKIVNEGKGKKTWTNSSGKVFEGYSADIQRLEEAIKNKTKVPGSKLNAQFASGTSAEDALKQLRARNAAYKAYIKQEKNLLAQLEQSIKANPIIQEFDDKIIETISGDKKVLEARAKLSAQFPAIFGETKGANLTAEQIETQAKDYAEKNLKKSFQENIDKAKADLDKLTSEKGKVNEEAKKAAEEKLSKAEAALKEQTEALGKKFKSGGMNKWLAAGIGAAALALAGLGIASSQKKDA